MKRLIAHRINFLLPIISAVLFTLTSCDVHEWPVPPEKVPFHLRLHYQTDMTKWEHLYDGETIQEVSVGPVYDNRREYGLIRYVVRAYPVSDKQRTSIDYQQEFIFTQDIASGYGYEATLDLIPGNYNIMVWSDIVQAPSDAPFYNCSNFSEIELQGKHTGNNDWRDAFRGTGNITLISDIMERLPDTLDVTMSRPLAKYEFITTDVDKFIQKEITRAEAKSKAEGKAPGETKVDIENYRILFSYVGFMPDTYSMFTDKPVDSSTGVQFESRLKSLSETEASLGFDYVMMNGKESAVTLQMTIIDKEGEHLSVSEPVKVPLMRSRHTILRGMFLVSEASGGVSINPEFDGDHNLIFK